LATLPTRTDDTPPVGPPPIVSLATWNEINYIINHRAGYFYWDVQTAINTLVGGPPLSQDPDYSIIPQNPASVTAILAAANANAATWQPQCGDKVGVIFVINDGTTPVQLLLLEVPCCCVTASVPSPTICATALPYQLTATASGGHGTLNYSWTGPQGPIPGDSATISVNQGGTYTVTVTDSGGCSPATASGVVTVDPLLMVTITPPTASVPPNTPVQFCASVSGGTKPYSYLWTGPDPTLPASGATTPCITVSTPGTYMVVVKDANGVCSAGASAPILTPKSGCQIIIAVQNVPITPVQFNGTGCGAPYTFSASGLPPGLTMSSGGLVSGIPTVAGPYSYTVTYTDGCGNLTIFICSVLVKPPPSANCVTVNAVQGVAITPVTMVGSGGCGGPYTFAATGLPNALTMSSSGTISGTSGTSGTFPYTVTITDSCGNTGTVNCSLTVSPCTGSICGNIFRDCNADGLQNSGEVGISGVTVTLKNSSGTVITSVSTDANGNYCFTGLSSSNYLVVVTTPANYELTTGTTLLRWTDGSGNLYWFDCYNTFHWKDTNNCHNWTDLTFTHHWETYDGKRYCNDSLGRMEKCDGKDVDKNDSAGAPCWKGTDGFTHWQDKSGNDCWIANDGCIHRKDSKGNQCWRTVDQACHWVDDTGQVCWKDKNGNCFHLDGNGNTCTNVVDENEERCSRCTGTNGVLSICLASCENKTDVNFGFTGTAPGISLTKTANKTSATCGDVITYTFVVTDTGNTCFNGGITVCDPLLGGTIFSQTPVSPGQSFTFTSNYVVTSSCPNPLVNTATATGHVPTGIGLQDVTATASVSTPLTLCASCNPPTQTCPKGSSKTITCNPFFGTSPYKYRWSTGDTSSSINCRNTGTYTCTVTDSKGATCQVSACITGN